MIRLYAPFCDALGRRDLVVPAAQGMPLEEFLRGLAERYPALSAYLAPGERQAGSVLPVLNGRFARAGDLVQPGDELLLCAQISGGGPRGPGWHPQEPGRQVLRGCRTGFKRSPSCLEEEGEP